MGGEFREYGRAVVKHFWGLLGGGALGGLGVASLRWQFHIPSALWFIGCGVAFVWVQFAAWRDMRAQRNEAVANAETAVRPVVVGGKAEGGGGGGRRGLRCRLSRSWR